MSTKVYSAEVVYLAPQSCEECRDRGRKSAEVCHDSFNCTLYTGEVVRDKRITAVDLGLEPAYDLSIVEEL